MMAQTSLWQLCMQQPIITFWLQPITDRKRDRKTAAFRVCLSLQPVKPVSDRLSAPHADCWPCAWLCLSGTSERFLSQGHGSGWGGFQAAQTELNPQQSTLKLVRPSSVNVLEDAFGLESWEGWPERLAHKPMWFWHNIPKPVRQTQMNCSYLRAPSLWRRQGR